MQRRKYDAAGIAGDYVRKDVDYVCYVTKVLTGTAPYMSISGYVFRNITSGMVREADEEGVVGRSCG